MIVFKFASSIYNEVFCLHFSQRILFWFNFSTLRPFQALLHFRLLAPRLLRNRDIDLLWQMRFVLCISCIISRAKLNRSVSNGSHSFSSFFTSSFTSIICVKSSLLILIFVPSINNQMYAENRRILCTYNNLMDYL